MSIDFGPTRFCSAEQALCHLTCSSIHFHLTGSRYFGLDKESSDWDFFVAANDGVEEELKKLGFELLQGNGSYLDSVTQSVWIYRKCFPNIHVQICNNIPIKLRAQDILYNTKILEFIACKDEARHVWSRLINYLKNNWYD